LNSFNKNVLTLVTGTSLAQAIPIAISPILTRIYTPEEFGLFSVYISIAVILSTLVTGKYELAILLPEEDSKSLNLLAISVALTTMFSVFILVLVIIWGNQIALLLGNEAVENWLYFIPLSTFFSGVYQSLNYWFNRKREFKLLAQNKVIQTVGSSSTNLGFGALGFGSGGLIYGNIVGIGASTFKLASKFYKKHWEEFCHKVSKFNVKNLASRYVNFPKFDLFASLCNISAHQVVNIFFSVLYSSSVAGNYHLIQRVFGIPVSVIARSVQDVFKEEMSRLYASNQNTREFYMKTFYKLAGLAFIPSILVFFLAEDLVTLFFGEDWSIAGTYAKYLTPVFFLRFISFPLSFMIYIAEKQYINMIIQFITVLAIIIIFFIIKPADPTTTVILLAAAYGTFYLSYILISYSLTKKTT
jgi:O-antigen/teichoic acid export membrane protein